MSNTEKIPGSPTKEFFIEMLTRDIPLIKAIVDLVDNSVDGAREMRPDGDLSGLWIKINFDKNDFKINDNCGGISIKRAREYAFKSGRPKNVELTPDSIGLFGVGMKRAFFKLGRSFKVESFTKEADFVVEENVNNWIKSKNTDAEKSDDWSFNLEKIEERPQGITRAYTGTRIYVSSLLPSTSESFNIEDFGNDLLLELKSAHAINMDAGIKISLNGKKVPATHFELLSSKILKPVYLQENYLSNIKVKIYAGIHKEREIDDGGWYCFCNGRMILEADQTITTGWGEGGDEFFQSTTLILHFFVVMFL